MSLLIIAHAFVFLSLIGITHQQQSIVVVLLHALNFWYS